jgi:hypothetical protein
LIRAPLVLCALLLVGASSLQLYGDTRYLLRASESIPALLARQQAGEAGVVIVMQPEDCLGAGELVARWNDLHRAGRFPVTALVVGSGDLSPRQQAVFKQAGATFPLRPIAAQDAGRVAEKLGYVSTPFAVVLDRHGRVAGSFPGLQNMSSEVLQQLISGT